VAVSVGAVCPTLFFTLSLVATIALDATFFFVAWVLVMVACHPTLGGIAGDDDAVAAAAAADNLVCQFAVIAVLQVTLIHLLLLRP